MKGKNFLAFGLSVLFLFTLLLSSCHQEYYKTKTGKAKQKYYNKIQFGADPHPKKKF